MIISLNWLKKFTDIDMPVDALTTLIGERLVEIESVTDLTEKYKDVKVARVIECVPLENSDHLNITKIDDGGVWENVERDENGYVQVVCGAPNVRAGLLVAWLPPHSIVPETFGTNEPFMLSVRPLRGVNSNGMLASARELDLFDEHDGILEIDKEAAPGSSFAELYELNDVLLDIENKSLTHRPDAFGVIGFAREVAGIQGKYFETPEWLNHLESAIENTASAEAPAVSIEDASLSSRFQVVVLSGVNEGAAAPLLMQTYLSRSGIRPINAAVDVSNYLMLLTGQPSHSYDYDKVRAIAGNDFTIRVRLARPNETLVLLDGKEVSLDESDVVIAAGETAIGLAGIMGGQSTLTDASTKTVLFEVATFDLYHMRSSQMRHGIFSEAVTRFTKGIPAPLSTPVAAEAVRMLAELTGAIAASGRIDDYPGKRQPIVVHVSVGHVNRLLGTHFTAEDVAEILGNVGFLVSFNGEDAAVTVPYWREDIHLPEDIIEEVGRLTGFDTINITLPQRDFVAVAPSSFDQLRATLRRSLARAGANEVFTYSFVHGDEVEKAGQSISNSYRIVNSISPELQYYRQSLTPSLLSLVHPNIKAGFNEFAVFELNKTHQKSDGMNEEHVPVEVDSMALVMSANKSQGTAYYKAKAMFEYILRGLGIVVFYQPLDNMHNAVASPFEPKRSAAIFSETGELIGVIGEYKTAVQRAYKLPPYTAGFEVLPRVLLSLADTTDYRYRPLSKYPGTERDICFQVAEGVGYSQVEAAVKHALDGSGYLFTVAPLDIYQDKGSATKNITIRVQLASYDKTLTNDEVRTVVDAIIRDVEQETEGKVI